MSDPNQPTSEFPLPFFRSRPREMSQEKLMFHPLLRVAPMHLVATCCNFEFLIILDQTDVSSNSCHIFLPIPWSVNGSVQKSWPGNCETPKRPKAGGSATFRLPNHQISSFFFGNLQAMVNNGDLMVDNGYLMVNNGESPLNLPFFFLPSFCWGFWCQRYAKPDIITAYHSHAVCPCRMAFRTSKLRDHSSWGASAASTISMGARDFGMY